ncbi:MAG: hypothetical protein Q8N26_35055 [Myxococcales bacterium]|nr:hypothetical protein [Myxococcales bacterium]
MHRRFNVIVAVGVIITGLWGCKTCEKLEEQLCADLGAADCALWKQAGGPASMVPAGRGAGRACGNVLNSDLGYQGMLTGARGTAIAEALKAAYESKDKDAIERTKGRLEEHKKAIQQGLDALKGR